MQGTSQRLHPEAGIAIGPILFVVALLGILAAVMAAGSSNMGTATRADSISPLLHTQANLIRSKMFECNTIRGSWPTSDASGTAVADVECPNDPTGQENLWNGARPAQLPQPPRGFTDWTYYDHSGDGGGRCIKIQPSTTAIAASVAVQQGVAQARIKFTSQEADYDSESENQSLVIWITQPSGSADSDCVAD
ncbi:MAG: hypothetical protein GC131_02545 [Alphaproteobacteria bacterium]|nr:hypothetical protein [Alphaproteobacteria bacterium]